MCKMLLEPVTVITENLGKGEFTYEVMKLYLTFFIFLLFEKILFI